MLVVGSRWRVWKRDWQCQRDLGRAPTASATLAHPGNNIHVVPRILLASNSSYSPFDIYHLP